MSEKSLFRGIKACVFDAYGTLFDFNSAVGRHRERLGGIADQVSALWRTKQLEYTWLRSLMGKYADFWQVTQDALDYTLDAFAVTDQNLRNDIINTYLELDCYPDVKGSLKSLKAGGLQLIILSNGTPTMLEAAVRSSGLSGFDRPDSLSRRGGHLQTGSARLSAGYRPLESSDRADRFPLLERLGCRGSGQCRPACRLDQSIRSAQGALAFTTGRGDQIPD